MSKATAHSNKVYIAGQMAVMKRGNSVAEQTLEILQILEKYLAGVNSDKSKLLMVTIWLVDMSDFDEMNRIWDDWITSVLPPARITVEANLNSRECQIEIAAIAAR